MPASDAGPILPEKLPHFFFEVAFELLPEVNYDDLIYLCALVRAGKREDMYSSLVDAVRKIQWMKLSGMDACSIDAVLTAQYDGSNDTAFHDPVGQIRHAKALLELVSHGKAALDSLAVFLNELLRLGFQGGDRDCRNDAFKKKLTAADPALKAFLQTEANWLQRNTAASASIISARDEWVHRGSPDVVLVWPPAEVGVLPIPNELTASVTNFPTKATHRSTREFAEFHYSRVLKLMNLVIALAINTEAGALPFAPTKQLGGQVRISIVKFRLTKAIAAQKVKHGPFTAQLTNAKQ
jgi:hypothetical protein